MLDAGATRARTGVRSLGVLAVRGAIHSDSRRDRPSGVGAAHDGHAGVDGPHGDNEHEDAIARSLTQSARTGYAVVRSIIDDGYDRQSLTVASPQPYNNGVTRLTEAAAVTAGRTVKRRG